MNQRSKRFHTNLVDVAEDVSSSSFWPSVSKSDTESCPDFRSRLSDRLSHIVCLIFSGYTAHGKVKDTVVDTVRRKVSDSQFSFTCNTDRVTSVRHPPSTGTPNRGKRFLQTLQLICFHHPYCCHCAPYIFLTRIENENKPVQSRITQIKDTHIKIIRYAILLI